MDNGELNGALHKYIDAFLGPTDTNQYGERERRERLARYCRSIVGSSMAPVGRRDAAAVVSDLQKRLVSSGRDPQSALMVARLFSMLKQSDPAYDWWPILHLISETAAAEALGGAGSISVGSNGFCGDREQRAQEQAMQVDEPDTRKARSIAVRPEQKAPDSNLVHRLLPAYDDIDEAALLQDLIYVMQGIDGTCVRWNDAEGAYVVRSDIRLSRPTRALVASVAELGALARDVQAYVAWADSSPGRLFEQSFSGELRKELAEYFKLVADIEAKLHRAPRGLRPGESTGGATLRRVLVWTSDARARLSLMSTAISSVRGGSGGGALLSTLSTLVDDGDPFTQEFARRLLRTASEPFAGILVRWVTTGELADPYNEFFVRASSERDGAWGRRYRVVRDMIPVHYDRILTRKIFQVGRSLAFLRGACADTAWVEQNAPQPQPGDTDDPRRLEAFVYRASAAVNARLMSVLRDSFGLLQHVAALRRLLMFEQGDFALALLDVLSRHIARAPRQLMAHDLSAALDSAVRASNAQFEAPEYLAGLVLALDTHSEADTSTASAPTPAPQDAWERVSLRYMLSPPLAYVVDSDTLRMYADISRFLLSIKRADHALTSAWRQQMAEARALQRSAELNRRKQVAASQPASAKSASAAVRESAIAVSEMIQFFHQVQRYISLSVIEGAWARFEADTRAADIDVDSWTEAHELYVRTIHGVVCGSAGAGFQRNLSAIVDTAFQFVAVVKELQSERTLASRTAEAALDKRMTKAELLLSKRSAANQSLLADPFAEHAARIHTVVTRFRDQVRDMTRMLSHNTANDLQFLVVSVDFNGTYTAAAR
ncbi:Microtubule-nucleating Tub4p (gamma-tubulin) complex component [Coemansia sp. Benny D115]|nr:Microtubule-nucleating Tub4p (gamma-tubulin) complex component [Coemansia sp. Benny D115]